LNAGDQLWADANSGSELHIGSTTMRMNSNTGIPKIRSRRIKGATQPENSDSVKQFVENGTREGGQILDSEVGSRVLLKSELERGSTRSYAGKLGPAGSPGQAVS
jgi:hypothetical protein